MKIEVPDDLYEEFRLLVAHRAFETTPDEYAKNLIQRELGQHDLPKFAERDKLTGCHTFRQFESDLTQQLMSHWYTKSKAFRFLCADISGLKEQNDTYGLPSGDKMIRKAADTLRLSYPGVPVYRVGGDEFIVTIPDGMSYDLKVAGGLILKHCLVEVSLPVRWMGSLEIGGIIRLQLNRALDEALPEGKLIVYTGEETAQAKRNFWKRISLFGYSGPSTGRPEHP